MIFQAFFDKQDQREAKREAKREKETKEWREEQAKRDAKLNNVLLNLQEQQSEIRAGIKDMITMLSPQNILAQGNTGALRSALRSGSAVNSQRVAILLAKSEVTSHGKYDYKTSGKLIDRQLLLILEK
ncbi:hypothetical protein IWW48_003774 [Coemansia sp. RSA 1200]|nr:hypothetical protein IWW48_003774 [Coemansia sp. RSA 1200]